MEVNRKNLFTRLLKFWALHLALAAAGALSLSLGALAQTYISSEAGAPVSIAAGIIMTGFYIYLFARLSSVIMKSRREGYFFSLIGALPLLLTILAAVLYLWKVPYNTIGYGYILLPVMLPFISWIEQVFPLLPYHILALTVPIAFAGAVIAGASKKDQ